MKKVLSVCVGLLLLGCLPVMAFVKGDVELSPHFQYTSSDNLDSTSLILEGGYHLDEKHQISGLIEYEKSEYAKTFEITGGFIGIGYDYNIIDKSDKHIPFIGGGLKLPNSDYKDIISRILYIHGGFKSFLSEKVAVRTSLDIEKITAEEPFDDDTSISLRLGIIIFFNIAQE